MPIKQFNFPGVTLSQEFVVSNIGSQAVLSVACIGRPYYLHRADVESEAATVEIEYEGTTTSAALLPGLVTEVPVDGSTPYIAPVDNSSARLFVRDGQFEHVTITGGTWATGLKSTDTTATLKMTGHVVKTGYGHVADSAFGTREAQVGDTVAISGSSVTGTAVITNITKSTDASGYDSVVVNLSGATVTGTAGTVTSVKFIVTDDAELYAAGGTSGVSITGGTNYQLKADIGAYIGGTSTLAPLVVDDIYVFAIQYRQENGLYKGRLGQVYNADDVEAILGGACLDNPLSLAVMFAAMAAPGTMVYFTTPKGNDVAKWKEALDFLDKYEEIYSIVPVTSDQTIITALLNDVITASEDEESKVRRSLWYGLDLTDADQVTAWNNPATSNETNVQNIINLKKSIPASYKAQAVFADGVVYGGENIPNYILAAAPAGMRSYQPCHRPLSNLGYSFFTLKESHGFTRSQLRTIGAEGIWIIGNNSDDIPINMRQVTTAVANDINKDEESIIANVDEVSLTLCRIGETRVGCSNITPIMLMALSDDIKFVMDQKLTNRSGSAYIGPQLISWNLDNIWQDPIQRDHVYATISCEPPKPFNQFKMTLRVI